jgi:hypothetical protein
MMDKLDSFGSTQRLVAGPCEHGNVPSGFIKYGGFDSLCNY